MLSTPEVQEEIQSLMTLWQYNPEKDGDATAFFVNNLLASIQSQKAVVARELERSNINQQITELTERLEQLNNGELDSELTE